MNKRLIYEEDAIDALKKAYWDKIIQSAKDDPCIVDAMTDWAIRQIKNLPSAQPPRIRAKWIYGDGCCKCLACGEDPIEFVETTGFDAALMNEENPMKFCPNCGARMSEELEPPHTMEEFMYGQDLGNPEDGSL